MPDQIYLVLFAFVFVINIIPAFMPPTWMVLAFFFIHFRLDLLPTVVLGATAAASGRVMLALLAKNYLRRFFSKKSLENYSFLGRFFRERSHLTVPIVLTYAFLPIPSNQVFILVGLTGLNLKLITFSFFVGRLMSYSFWVHLSSIAQSSLDSIFFEHLSRSSTLLFEGIGFLLIYLIGKINWKKLLF